MVAGKFTAGNWEVIYREPGSHLPGTGKILCGNKQVPKIHFPGTGKSNSGSRASYDLPSLIDSYGIWPIYI